MKIRLEPDDVVWKYGIPVKPHVIVPMPKGARVIHVAEQHGTLCLWAVISRSAIPREQQERHFFIRGTGQPLDNHVPWRHIATVLCEDGALVWHVFEPEAV